MRAFLNWLFQRGASCAELREDVVRLSVELGEALRAREDWRAVAQRMCGEKDRCFVAVCHAQAEVGELRDLLARERRWNAEMRAEMKVLRGNVEWMRRLMEAPVYSPFPNSEFEIQNLERV